MIIGQLPANRAWAVLLRSVAAGGVEIAGPGASSVESLGITSRVDMSFPVVTTPRRITPGYFPFMAAEAYWILTGSSLLSGLSPQAPTYGKFSDNGYTLQGAYGPRVVEQLSFIRDTLIDNLYSRQAVIEIWRPNPRKSKDIPCTLSLQFLCRKSFKPPYSHELNCIVTMRSSDLWLGWPFDIFNFSMITLWICLHLRPWVGTIIPGGLQLTAGSQHIYVKDLPQVAGVIQTEDNGENFNIQSHGLNTPDDLIMNLGHMRDGRMNKITWPSLAALAKFAYAKKNT